MPSNGNLLPKVSALPAFMLLNSQMQVLHPNQGSRSIGNQEMDIVRRTWAHKFLPPNIKAFFWRLIRTAIATGARAGNLSNKISKYYATCNSIENDSHLFFHLQLCKGGLVLIQNTPMHFFASFVNRMAYRRFFLLSSETTLRIQNNDHPLVYLESGQRNIWKARNDTRFQGGPRTKATRAMALVVA